jgi:hypothetical protein
MKVAHFVAAGTCLALLFLLTAPMFRAQEQPTATPILRMGRYDKRTETVANGTIVSIQAQRRSMTMPRGTYVVLQSGPLTLNTHLGLFSGENFPFKTGDQVSVTGSLITIHGNQFLLARQIRSGTQSLTIRSSNGFVLRAHPVVQAQGGRQ